MALRKQVVDCATGASSSVPLTAEEETARLAEIAAAEAEAAQEAQVEAVDVADRGKIRAQLAARVAKARAILDDPAGAPDWTAVERKVILAATLLDLNQRHR